ncbi:hypothetical protein ACE6H2_006768 [Prunus campanulata]
MTINIRLDDYESSGKSLEKKANVLGFVDIVAGTVDLTLPFLSTLVRKEPGAAPKNLSEKLIWENLVEDFSRTRGADGILATIVAGGNADGVVAVVGSIVVANTGAEDDVPYILEHLCNPFN